MPDIYIWKKAPFIRILISLIAGILVQWYLQVATIGLVVLSWWFVLAAVFSFFISP